MFIKIVWLVTIANCMNLTIPHNFTRQGKFWPVWPVGLVKFKNDVCTTLEGYDGICYTKIECRDAEGISSTSCANRIGVCCLFQATCGGTSAYNNTYFMNPGFPGTFSGSTSCTFTIQKCSSDICQVRLDFLSLILAQPDGHGRCVTDSLIISGGASNIPIICGENSGQHLYLNFNGDNDITITISTRASVNLGRSWNIKVAQLSCDCPSLAPTGCLQYYADLTGTVNSFNYGATLSGNLIDIGGGQVRPGTRQMVNQNYGVCIQMQPGYCSIEWSQGSDPTSFTVSGNTALTAVTPGLPGNGLIGDQCPNDFVVIPYPTYPTGIAVGADRFCGNQFPTVRSSSKPFIMTVVTNGNEGGTQEIANRGFSLDYRQIRCDGIPGFVLGP